MKKKKIKIILVVVLLVLIILVVAWYKYYQYDKENLKIDYYNFQQLEKVKKVIENIPENKKTYRVRNLKQLNSKFKADIEPLDKRYCYYVYYQFDKENNKPVFGFWFKLHSLLYKLRYWWEYYKYPNWIHKSEPSEQCKKEMEISSKLWWYRWMPACAWLNVYYYRYMEAVNNPCEK